MQDVHARLKWLRKALGLSLREMAARLAEVGYPVSHDSVWKYERGATVPADYAGAVSERFGVNLEWLLASDRSPVRDTFDRRGEVSAEIEALARVFGDSRERRRRGTEDVKRSWEAFVEGQPPGHPLRDVILRSWKRSRDGDVDPSPRSVEYRRVTPEELDRRLAKCAHLVSSAAPHLEWLSSLLGDVDHVLYLACPDGIVLVSRSPEHSLPALWGLEPGADWSEKIMGTSGSAIALREDRIAAVVGTEHFLEPFHRTVCLAAPVRGPDGRILGAIDLSAPVEQGRPERLALVAYAAAMIERDLEGSES